MTRLFRMQQLPTFLEPCMKSIRGLTLAVSTILSAGLSWEELSAAATAPIAVPPASIAVGATLTSIASDGTTAIVATLKRADGSLFIDRPIPVTFTSTCTVSGVATLDRTVSSTNGIAAATYLPVGCKNGDVVVASVAGTTLKGSVSLQIGLTPSLSAKAALGRTLFFDKALSASGNLACASCHSPANGYLDPSGSPLPLGGLKGTSVGFRTAPTAAYAALTPPFGFLTVTNKAGTVNNSANGKLGTPRRGLMWDGRASTVFDQAKGPLLGPQEMANASSVDVLSKLLQRPYLAAFNSIYGVTSGSSNPDVVLTNIADAIATYETEDKSFSQFNSKFDAVQKGQVQFTAQEARGQALFFDNKKGACLGCHNSDSNAHAVQGPQMFTDLSYRVLSVPRNWKIPYNNDSTVVGALQSLNVSLPAFLNGGTLGTPNHQYYDLGFCGPFRADSLGDAPLCGAFRVPTLRNVALKSAYFHNGVYTSLDQVINFYVNRDASPKSIYLKADGTPDIPYNDLPLIYQGNREIRPPFTPVSSGTRLTISERQDLLTFLCTLTDGFDPQHPDTYRLPSQCRNAIRN